MRDLNNCNDQSLKSYAIIFTERTKDHERLFLEGVTVKRELCRHRMNQEQKAEVSDGPVNQLLMAELLLTQNCEAERLFSDFHAMVRGNSSYFLGYNKYSNCLLHVIKLPN